MTASEALIEAAFASWKDREDDPSVLSTFRAPLVFNYVEREVGTSVSICLSLYPFFLCGALCICTVVCTNVTLRLGKTKILQRRFAIDCQSNSGVQLRREEGRSASPLPLFLYLSLTLYRSLCLCFCLSESTLSLDHPRVLSAFRVCSQKLVYDSLHPPFLAP